MKGDETPLAVRLIEEDWPQRPAPVIGGDLHTFDILRDRNRLDTIGYLPYCTVVA